MSPDGMSADGMTALSERMESLVRDLPDYPKPGILFRDIMPLLATPGALADLTTGMAAAWTADDIDMVVGIEARGFILGAPIAEKLGAGFVPMRKPGKLPPPVLAQSYDLEYGTDQLEIPAGVFAGGARTLIVDDVLATGGTAAAAAALVTADGGRVAGYGMFIEIAPLQGRDRLGSTPLHCVVSYR